MQRWLSVQKRAVESGMKVMQQYLNEPSLRVGIVPLLDDNYGNEGTLIDIKNDPIP